MVTPAVSTEKHSPRYGTAKVPPADFEAYRQLADDLGTTMVELFAAGRRVLEAVPRDQLVQAVRDFRMSKIDALS